MAIQGLRHTNNFVQDERPLHWRAGILMRYPNGKAPLTALTAAMKTEQVNDPQFHWWEKALESRRFALTTTMTAPAAGTAQTLVVASGATGMKRGDVLLVEHSGELLYVPTDPVTQTDLPVTRGFANSTPAVVTVGTHNPNIKVIGSAYEEASRAPTGVSWDPTKKSNYTQIFRQTFEMSRTASKTTLRTKDQVAEAKRECLEYYSIGQEWAFWHGKPSESTLNGKALRTTGGVFHYIDPGNVLDLAGVDLDMDKLEESILEPMFRYGSSEKVALCGNRALLGLNQTVRKNSQYNITFGVKEYGMNMARLVCPFGELVLKSHPLWNQMTSNLAPATPVYYGMDTWLCALDMADIKYAYLKESDTKYEKELTEIGLDGMKSGYISECGLEFHHGVNHFLVKGLAGGKKDL
jgi:hypothetical protein